MIGPRAVFRWWGVGCGMKGPQMAKTKEVGLGAIIGSVQMVGCATSYDSEWFDGDYGFIFGDLSLDPLRVNRGNGRRRGHPLRHSFTIKPLLSAYCAYRNWSGPPCGPQSLRQIKNCGPRGGYSIGSAPGGSGRSRRTTGRTTRRATPSGRRSGGIRPSSSACGRCLTARWADALATVRAFQASVTKRAFE